MADGSSLPLLKPMLATLGELPEKPGWGYEIKWDGMRAVVQVSAGRPRIWSRNAREVSHAYPELGALTGRPAVLDGEIVAPDRHGNPSFGLLQHRMHVTVPSGDLLARVPVQFYVFDVLHLDGRSTLDTRYERRRELLDALDLDGPVVRTPPYWTGDEGRGLLAVATELGLEGVVAKRLDSAYVPGARSRSWIKVPLNRTVEVVVGGWQPGSGRRAGTMGSLLLGGYDDAGRLVFVGHVGTGFTDRALADMDRRLEPLARPDPPFDPPVPGADARGARWVTPSLVGEVAFRTGTLDGRLRHPSWRGLRPDRDPAEVRVDRLLR